MSGILELAEDSTPSAGLKKFNRRQWLKGTGAVIGASVMPMSWLQASMKAGSGEMLPQPDHIIRANFNENPYGVSRVALRAIQNTFNVAGHYGGGPRQQVMDVMTELHNLPPEQIILGSGSGELLKVAGLMAGMANGSVVCADPTYHDLIRFAERNGSDIIKVPVRDDLGMDLEAMKKAIRKDTKIVYIVNPNNPIPSIIAKRELESFVKEVAKKCMVFVDEAYFEFVQDPSYGSMIDLVRAGQKNLIVTRTASKIHGMAGLRVGFGFGDADLIKELAKIKTGQMNVLGLAGAAASYTDNEFQDFTRRKTQESKLIMENMISELGLRTTKSHANFVFFETGRAVEEVNARLKEKGLLSGRPFPPYLKWARVSLQKPEEMRYFAQTYKQLFG
jgi:histidinol-phosphate aminotransferase